MVIITGLAAGQATAGAAVSDGRSRNVGNGAAMAGPGGRRQARVRRVRPVGLRVAPAGEHSSGCTAVRGARHATGRNSGPCESRPAGVLEEAPDELVAGHGFLALAVGGAVLVTI